MVYSNLTGSASGAIQLTLNYHSGVPPTNASATPVLRGITIRDVHVKTSRSFLECNGIPESPIAGIVFENVVVTGSSKETCSSCTIAASATSPALEAACTG